MHEDRHAAQRGKHRKQRPSQSTGSLDVGRKHTRQRLHPGDSNRNGRSRRHLLNIVLFSLGSAAGIVLAVLTGFVMDMLRGLPKVSANTFTNKSVGSVVYDVHGRVLGCFAKNGDRQPIDSVHQVSDSLVAAFVAAEDRTFYQNIGVSPIAIIRALAQNIAGRRIQSGASTITQQTVKLAVFPEQQRTVRRKIQEMALSLEVNHILTKDEIMTDYMNWVYMGRMGFHNVYGVKTASQILFHKEPSELNLSQSAFLAAIPNNPSYFSPYLHPSHTLLRQHYILNQMLQNGTITKDDYLRAIAYPIQAAVHAPPSSTDRYPYVMAQVESKVAQELVKAGMYKSVEEADAALPSAGYQIHTTINMDAQNRVDRILNQESLFRNTSRTAPGVRRRDLYQAGVVIVDNATGDIVALDGGRPNHYAEDQINHADTPRQPGSAMKPLVVYGPAIQLHTLTASSLLDDGPGIFDEGLPWQYEPKDNVPWWHGMVTVRQALVESLNLPAIRALNLLHPEVGTSFLPGLGIHVGDKTDAGQLTFVSDDTHHLGTGIGGLTYGLTLEQMTSAYTVFPNQGIWREPTLVLRITDDTGSTIYAAKPFAHRVFSPQTAFIMTSILHDVVDRRDGTARVIGRRFPGAAIAGKTGTTDDQQNGWLIAYTPQYTMGIWMGYNHNEPIPSSIYGLKFRLWADIMAPLVPGRASTWASNRPPDVVSAEFCRTSGTLATEACRQSRTAARDWFIAGTEPTRPCDVHTFDIGPIKEYPQPQTVVPMVAHVTALESTAGVALSWDPVPGVGMYTIWRSATPTGPFERIGPATPLTVGVDSEVPNRVTQVFYQIHAESGDGSAIPSKTICVVLHHASGSIPSPTRIQTM